LNEKIHAHFTHKGGYKFEITFDELPTARMLSDEPIPTGESAGPSAAMLLSGAVGHCLCSSLLFCLEKSRAKATDLKTDVELSLIRNEKGRWRISGIKVKMKPTVAEMDREKLERCKTMFQDFCIVTASVREGIKVDVEVEKD
jgi:uncharacterized OsmC-like protein